MSEYYNPDVQQQYPDTCAIKSQQLILEDFGIDVSENQLVQTANANGWYNGALILRMLGICLILQEFL